MKHAWRLLKKGWLIFAAVIAYAFWQLRSDGAKQDPLKEATKSKIRRRQKKIAKAEKKAEEASARFSNRLKEIENESDNGLSLSDRYRRLRKSSSSD